MISMTTYWQQFKECIDNLQMSTHDIDCTRQISTAQNLIAIGLTIEKLGLLEIQQVSDQLHEKAKLFQNEIFYTTNNHEYTFYLPKITNAQSFIFAIIYYQHLLNYQNVSYQGSINWFRQKVIDAMNQKKITTAIQAQALLQEIRQYYQKQNLNVDELLFLKKEEESISEYTSRLVKTFNCPVEQPQNETKVHLPPLDEITTLKKSLEFLNQKLNQLKIKADLIDQKLSVFKQAKRDYLQLTNEWKNKWFITKAFYWFLSLFIEVPEINNLKAAHAHLIHTKNDLNQELKNRSPKVYCAKLQKQLRKLECEQVKIKSEITLKNEIQQKKHTPTLTLLSHKELEKSVESKSEIKEGDDSSYLETSSNNDYYGFFKKNLPSRYTLQAIAVGAAAIAIQNLL
ncbi:hypothetical protein Lgra_2375 [Legionella gratiana]|uniref:Uncharacterized protein n=1 Tax=Legionella gratiana TaxID=45066 RepID=A0A378JE82_9GAMM|nr:hypothetical protein [Legionella gratiana]KTD09140.1 hypothetical protein Lgra_2375 [Legionella gratiana]STX45646.1 Uncharacterised protein [Legionella gratiana]